MLKGLKLISWLDLIKKTRAGYYGLIQTLFDFTSIAPWFEIVVWAIQDLRKSNWDCPDMAALYLKYIALWVLE